MSVRLNRRGATLPLTIIVISLMAVAVATSYHRLSSERAITGDGQAQVDAFAVAQSGLNAYLAGLNGMPPTSHDTTITGLAGGSAQVKLRRLKDSVMTTSLIPAVFIITSRGLNTTAKRYGARTPPAERTVATYAQWVPAPLDLNAAFTSLSGLDKNGNSGALDGNDACAGSGLPAIPGVAVPNGTFTGQAGPINGNPDNTPVGIGTAGPAGTAKDEVAIDWAGITAGTTLPPDYVYPTWPTAAQFNDWPVVLVNGNVTLPGDGKGVLIVTGNMTLSGSTTWDGLVLVGGTVTSNGNNTINGAIVSGLNVKLGQIVPQTAIGNGNKTFQYHSCNLTRALGHIGSIQRIRNGWTDTWSSY